MKGGNTIHPYIPNSVPAVKEEMMREIGVASTEELYGQMIPERLRLRRRMNLPNPFPAELDLKRHVEEILLKDRTCTDYLSFLGGGCWQHFIPEVCDEIIGRSEFLTAYAGGPYSDLGRFQAVFEFQSMICELVGMEVSGIPTYDWGSAAGNAIRMASRITGRREALVPANISPARLSIISNFCNPTTTGDRIFVKQVNYDPKKAILELGDLEAKINEKTACVYFENPSYLGVIESQGADISKIAHDHGAESIVGVDPISLGILAPPADYGADIVCGEAQSLGIHMHAGGGLSGFITSRDDDRYVGEYPLRLITITNTAEEGEYGFGQCRYERTSYIAREKAKDWVGTTTTLWAIAAAVYMSLMGPEGMRKVGESIIQRSHYVVKYLSEIEDVKIQFDDFFKEFLVDFEATGWTVARVNHGLLKHRIFGGKDISVEFPELGQSSLYCVTENHKQSDLDRLVSTLREVLA